MTITYTESTIPNQISQIRRSESSNTESGDPNQTIPNQEIRIKQYRIRRSESNNTESLFTPSLPLSSLSLPPPPPEIGNWTEVSKKFYSTYFLHPFSSFNSDLIRGGGGGLPNRENFWDWIYPFPEISSNFGSGSRKAFHPLPNRPNREKILRLDLSATPPNSDCWVYGRESWSVGPEAYLL